MSFLLCSAEESTLRAMRNAVCPGKILQRVFGSRILVEIGCIGSVQLERAKERLPAFDLDGFLTVVAAFVNQTELDQSPDHARGRLIQDPHDVADGKMVIGEEIANGCLPFEGRIQSGSVGGHHESLGS